MEVKRSTGDMKRRGGEGREWKRRMGLMKGRVGEKRAYRLHLVSLLYYNAQHF